MEEMEDFDEEYDSSYIEHNVTSRNILYCTKEILLILEKSTKGKTEKFHRSR